MNPSTNPNRPFEWSGYYNQFTYFSSNTVRDGCYPRMMEHSQSAEKAVVLVQGLTDSPYFMTAIGDYFFRELGYNVYLPLLQCHGLKEPNGMRGVTYVEWNKNVKFAIAAAAAIAKRVSIGGLSTGGTLSMYAALTNPQVNDSVYLFSAALRLAGIGGQFGGKINEWLVQTPLVDVLKDTKPLIGPNPYRYDHIVLLGARELLHVMGRVDELLKPYNANAPLKKKIFAAHSEADATAGIWGIEALQQRASPDTFTFFRIAHALNVPHASVVLQAPVYASNAKPGDAPLEPANPKFAEMMRGIKQFAR